MQYIYSNVDTCVLHLLQTPWGAFEEQTEKHGQFQTVNDRWNEPDPRRIPLKWYVGGQQRRELDYLLTLLCTLWGYRLGSQHRKLADFINGVNDEN